MIKVIGFIPRRPDISRADFRHYYETQHVLLALSRIRSFTKYVRNHVAAGAVQEPGFDCLPEWWFTAPEVAADIATWVASPAGEVLHRDEANFMDRPRMASCPVSDELLFGPQRPIEPWLVRKRGLAITRAPTADPAAFAADITRFGEELIRRNQGAVMRVSRDLPLDPLQTAYPLDALFWVWPTAPGAVIEVPERGPAIGSCSELGFEAIETPPAALSG